MNRNIFFISSLLVFLLFTYGINNWVKIIDNPNAKSVYMNNKKNKIKKVKIYHKKAKDNYILFFQK